MGTYKETALACIKEIETVLSHVNEDEMKRTAAVLSEAERIFISGDGRSGLMGKAIAMRLMHAGYHVYVTGETITPSIGDGDLLVLISGSASGSAARDFVEKAKKAGAKAALVTANPESHLAGQCEAVLFLPAATKQRKDHEPGTIQPLGNQFDQSVHLALDALIVKMTARQEGASMHGRHANLE